MFFICFASFENPKTYQPAREKNKQTRENNKIHADILELCLIIKMSHINGKGLSRINKIILHILLGKLCLMQKINILLKDFYFWRRENIKRNTQLLSPGYPQQRFDFLGKQ
jgi:hypothetical protein